MTKLAKVSYKEENAVKELSKKLYEIFKENNDIVIVNIGTDRVIGDVVAPLVGTLLKENKYRFPVYGDCESPIHALNIEKRIKEIKTKHPNSTIIGIDACLGDSESIGEIQLRDYPVSPGKGVGKTLPEVGSYSIIGIVDASDSNELFTNRSIRLDLILKISKTITKALIKAEKKYYINNKEVAICNF